MAKPTATVTKQGWQEHTCTLCHTVYRVRFSLEQTASADTDAEAQGKAEKAMQSTLKDHSELRPCPNCGLIQPSMVGSWRLGFHALITLVTLGLVWGVLVSGGNDYFTKQTVLWLTTVIAVLIATGHLLVSQRSFNADLDGNVRQSRELLDKGDMQIVQTGAAPDPHGRSDAARSCRQPGYWPIFGLLIAATLVVPAAEVIRLASGWPSNSGWYPPAAGPGDKPYFYFADEIQCVKGLWSGQATAEAVNFKELGLSSKALKTETKQDSWATSISVVTGEKYRSAVPWVYVHVPEVADPSGKKMSVKIDLKALYPALEGGINYKDQTTTLHYTGEVLLAPAGAGTLYLRLWWFGVLSFAVVPVTAGIALVVGDVLIKGRGRQARMLTLEGQPLPLD